MYSVGDLEITRQEFTLGRLGEKSRCDMCHQSMDTYKCIYKDQKEKVMAVGETNLFVAGGVRVQLIRLACLIS